jgi:hypothetical protein
MMTQPPQDGPGPLAGHPEPEPVPEPEPGPPQPIPPPDPVPAPEPPHAVAPPPAAAPETPPAAVPEPPAAAAPEATDVPTGANPPGWPPRAGNDETAAFTPFPVDTASLPTTRFADILDGDPPTARVEWPPVGAYPDEPGHPVTPPTAPFPPAATTHPGWAQPPPATPWHAHHEKAGEWQTRPPEHLALDHSPPAVNGPVPDPIWAGHAPPAAAPPWQVPLDPAPPNRRGGLWVSLALTVILLFCGGGAISAYFLISNADTGKGAADPATAVNRFLTAVYTQQDPAAAEQLVCRQARDKKKLTDRVDQIKGYINEYQGPTFRWSDPAVNGQTDKRAVVTTQLTLSTDDEKQAQQMLTFTTIHKTGWLVCDVAG